MEKNKIVKDSENQHLMRLDSEKKEEVKKVQNEKTTEIESTFTRHVGPREVIENDISKLYPIQSGIIKVYSFKGGAKKLYSIVPDDLGRESRVEIGEQECKDGDPVKYIKVPLGFGPDGGGKEATGALLTSKGVVSSKSIGGDIKFLFVSPDNGGNNVSLSLKPTFPHNKVEGHANVADKSQPEYPIDVTSFQQGDAVEFVANTKGNVVAIKKIDK